MSDLKGVPKRVILTAPARVYPTTLIAYAELIVQDGMVVKDRHGMKRKATAEDLASCKVLTPTEARIAIDAAAWRGETPAEGTRRAIVLEAIRKGDVLSDAEALEIADTVELALLASSEVDAERPFDEPSNMTRQLYSDAHLVEEFLSLTISEPDSYPTMSEQKQAEIDREMIGFAKAQEKLREFIALCGVDAVADLADVRDDRQPRPQDVGGLRVWMR